ncbi:MAG: phosphodiester glycosidase family protein [Clostridia bacterium]|nr:phosphodiester glycosidase family protein [Clostridia bacterium]
MKRFLSFMLCSLICIMSLTSSAQYLYEESYSKTIADGINFQYKNILTKNTWIKAYIAYVDLENPNTEFKVMTAKKGSSYLENVKSMAQNEGATVAINADFFNTGSNQTNMLGMTYKDGELISTPALDNQASIVLTENNEIIMDYFSFTSTVYSPQGYSCPIYQINKVPASGGAITMLTDKWADTSWGKGFKELIVKSDAVVEIREAQSDAAPIPQGGYVLVTNPEVNGFFDNFQIGDEVKIEFNLTPDIEGIKEATGGNTLLVDEGKVAKFTGNVTGYAQRSAVGIKADGKTLILAVTDGREADCRGLTQTEMAQLMISLGAEKAINLDGGGSSTFVMKNPDGEYKAANGASYLRPVSTAIGIKDFGKKGTKAKTGVLKADKERVLLGDTINLSADFFDEYGIEFYPEKNNVRYYTADGKTIDGGKFTPEKAGSYAVYATADDAICRLYVYAKDRISSINILDNDISIKKGESKEIGIVAYDDEGNAIDINPELISWKSDNDKVKVTNGKLSITQDGEGAVIECEYDGKKDYVSINRKAFEKKAPFGTEADIISLFKGRIDDGHTVAVSGTVPKGTTLLNRFYSLERLKLLGGYDKAYVTDNFYGENAEENTTTAKDYSIYRKDGTSFVTLSTNDGKIKNAPHWAGIYSDLKNDSENIVFITKKAPHELPKEEEKRMKAMFKEAFKNGKKSIFYVYSGSKPEVFFEGGVTYISAGQVEEYKTDTMVETKKYCAYVVFTVKGNEIKFEFVE